MYKPTIAIAALCLCVLPWAQALAENGTNPRPQNDPNSVTIAPIESKVMDKTLEIRYRITNGSDHDIWLCERVLIGCAFETYTQELGQTLVMRRRFDVRPELMWSVSPTGSYVRLRAGETRTELVMLHLPVPLLGVFTSAGRMETQDVSDATRLLVEIGFYRADLLREILSLLEARARDERTTAAGYRPASMLFFTRTNEDVRDRDERVVFSYDEVLLPEAEVLQLTLDNQAIPYMASWKDLGKLEPPDMDDCKRVEIRCPSSAWEFLLPYVGQQALLSAAEKEDLRSQRVITLSDPVSIAALRDDLQRAYDAPHIVVVEPTAQVVCETGSRPPTAFTFYGEGLPSLKAMAPLIRPFEQRIQCARNLKNLWYRLRFYRFGEETRLTPPQAKTQGVCPPPAQWTEALVQSWAHMGAQDAILRPFRCPSANEGKCHYAMNPNCEPNSPPDTVLLFETKAGWNQHGGPVEFTFDNHDPKGGCVLLNDGTVKFIRTKEELQQLRWKP